MWKWILAVAVVAPLDSAQAQIDITTMSKGSGLAEIIFKAEHCGYAVDQAKLDKYFAANGLDTPESLTWISNAIKAAEYEGKPTASDCTMARATARKIGVIAE